VKKEVFVIVHGHFYQPPRENPWTGRIEKHASAAPYHDWNELIAAQCYVPNGASRVLDAQRRIEAAVNNYEYMSFDIGPTLFSWLERHEVDTYGRIIEADKVSRERNDGHGNALAQPFNHTILPLSTLRDQRTQVEWGIRDFRRRFKRDPEGMWLPETAVNYATLEVLFDKGIGFTVLSPTQARRFRPIGLTDWISCEKVPLDPTRPYRVYLRDEKGKRDPSRWVDVFFFDWPLSVAVSFEHLLTNGDRFAERIAAAVPDRPGPIVVTIATDGETFGHHEPFGDMCLAYFFRKSAARQGFKVTNFGACLEKFQPDMEAELELGPAGEGSSWSCAHGLGRWQNDCGCATGGPKWWNQAWRRPLRDAVTLLTKEVDKLFEKLGARLCRDVWAARDDYVEVMLDGAVPSTIEAFCRKHLKTPGRETTLLNLCLMQMFSQFALTSCGWFFSEISGLETTQNLKYAARAIEIAEQLGHSTLRASFLKILDGAVSNDPEAGTGSDLFDKALRQSRFSEENMAACHAIGRLLSDEAAPAAVDTFYYTIEEIRTDSVPDRYESMVGFLRVGNKLNLDERHYAYFATRFTPRDVRCYLKQLSDVIEYEVLLAKLQQIDKSQAATLFGGRYYSWTDMVPEAAEQMMQRMLAESIAGIHDAFEEIYLAKRDMFQAYVETGLDLPVEVQGIVRFTLTKLFTREIMSRRGHWRREQFAHAASLLAEAKALGLEVDKTEAEKLINEDIASAAEDLRSTRSSRALERLVSIIEVVDMLGLTVRKFLAENAAMEHLTTVLAPAVEAAKGAKGTRKTEELKRSLKHIERLNIAVDDYLSALA